MYEATKTTLALVFKRQVRGGLDTLVLRTPLIVCALNFSCYMEDLLKANITATDQEY